MAVKPERIKGRLKVLFPKANLSTKRMDAIADRLAKKPADDAEDDAVDQVINDANDFMPFEDIAKEDDRLRSLEEKAKGNKNDPPKQDPPKTDPPKQDDDMPSWAKGLVETNTKLLNEVEGLKKGKILEDKLTTARSVFDKSEVLKGLKDSVKDRWFSRINPESEASIDDQIKELEDEYTELFQGKADGGDYAGAPGSGSADQKPSKEAVNAVVDQL